MSETRGTPCSLAVLMQRWAEAYGTDPEGRHIRNVVVVSVPEMIRAENRIAALEAALVEIRDRSFRCLLPAEEIETEREFFAYAEINEIGMKADHVLNGEVKE